MENNKINFSVFILTYNQKDCIGNAIQSCLDQEVLPYEIIVADDCSQDGNQEVIKSYQKKYPDIIKPLFNEKNVWIYENYNNAIKYLKGDIGICLAGDDLLPKGAIKFAYDAIIDSQIDFKNTKICVVGNNRIIYPSGKERIHDNYRIRNNSAFKEQLRSGLSTRDFGFSVSTLQSNPIDSSYGTSADTIRTLNLISDTKEFIFIKEIVAVYNLGFGVTSKFTMRDYCESGKKYIDFISKENYPQLDKNDIKFIKYRKALINYFTSSTLNSIYHYFLFAYHLLINRNNFSINSKFSQRLKYLIPFYSFLSIRAKNFIYRK
jgi:glycosyltransferase involved in cell wall biosynthesis